MVGASFNIGSSPERPAGGAGARADAARPLRVLFDGRKLGHGGIGVYSENLIAGLVGLPEVALTVAGDPAIIESFPWASNVTIVPETTAPYSFAELFALGRRFEVLPFDVFHTPHYMLPLGMRRPTVITVHDLIQVNQPERFYYPLVAGGLIRSAVRRATKVLTVSEASRRELAEFVRAPRLAAKIEIIPNAVDPTFARPRSELGVVGSFTITPPYFLSVVSMAKPHKGVEPLIRAFAWARERSLAVAGTTLGLVGYGAESGAIARLAESLGCGDAVRPLGRVTKPELAALYAGARAVVCPSRAEGFCLPVLEAHAAGTPVIVTPVPAIQELVTDADIVCEDFSPSALGRGMIEFCERPEVSFGGRDAVVAAYSRAAVAARAVETYRAACRAHRGEGER